MIMHLQDLNLSKDEKERVEALHQTYGFIVYNAGFSCTMEEGRKVEMCYWRCLRGVRESALFPTHEAAWRDALRAHEEAVDAVKASPGVTRVKSLPADEAKHLSSIKKHMMNAGFTFCGGDWAWQRNGLHVDGFDSHAAAIKDATKIWARDNPEDLIDAMNKMAQGNMEARREPLTPLTSEELAKLQGMPGYSELPPEHQQLTLESQQLLKHMVQRGIKIDFSFLNDANDLAAAAGVSYKSRGKSFEEVEEDLHRSKRVYGLVEDSPEAVQIRHLEAIGYEFFFTSSTSGWVCKQIDRSVACGALMTVVKAAWEMMVSENGAAWQGIGQPPPGTVLWITPHNLLWGFDVVDVYLCEVMMYDGEHVWLKLLSDLGHDIGKYITTRIDKVDVKVWKGNNDD